MVTKKKTAKKSKKKVAKKVEGKKSTLVAEDTKTLQEQLDDMQKEADAKAKAAGEQLKKKPLNIPVATYSLSPKDPVGKRSVEDEEEFSSLRDKAAFYQDVAKTRKELLVALEDENLILRKRIYTLEKKLDIYENALEKGLKNREEAHKALKNIFESPVSQVFGSTCCKTDNA